jgi:ribose transport system ATP-binding protein
VALRNPTQAMRAGIAYVPEDRASDGTFPDLTVSENLSIGMLRKYCRRGRLRMRSERTDTRELISSFQIRCASGTAPLSSLSGGNQQKVILARSMARDPQVLLLDEPTQGVDFGARTEIYGFIKRAAERGAGTLLVSSDEEELELLCDRILTMSRGCIQPGAKT